MRQWSERAEPTLPQPCRKPGDPLVDFLECMRHGKRFPEHIWRAFEKTIASDRHGVLDPRHRTAKFALGYGLSMYWETLSRWISHRSRRDARELGLPLVFLQAVDECNTIDRGAAHRLLNIPNMHSTGHIHGVLPAHVGMRVRIAVKVNSTLGLVQEQRATIVDFVFKEEDRERYNRAGPGTIFRPTYLPAGIWLQVDDFCDFPLHEELLPFLDDGAKERAKGLHLYSPIETEFTWRSSETHTIKRTGFALTHEKFLTSTASQGQTIRTGVTIDCARQLPAGKIGMKEDQWWLHLYVMFSRATSMTDMLLLRPPPRTLLEAGPPRSVRAALARFEEKIAASTDAASSLAGRFGIVVPD